MALFLTVVDAGGMTAAADELGVSQPAVSRSVRTMERELGVALFQRDGRGVVPTDAGCRLADGLRTVTADWDRLVAEVRLVAGRPSEVVVSVPFGTARALIPVIVRRATTELAGITTRVVEARSADGLDAVADGSVAAAVVYRNGSRPVAAGSISSTDVGPGSYRGPGLVGDPELDGVCIEPMARERLYAVGRPERVGQDGEPVALGDLAGAPMLLIGSAWPIRSLVDEAFANAGVTPTLAREVGVSEALLAFAIEGDGVAILPFSNVAHELDRGTLVARPVIEPSIERTIAVALSTRLPPTVGADVRRVVQASIREVAPNARWTVEGEGDDQ